MEERDAMKTDGKLHKLENQGKISRWLVGNTVGVTACIVVAHIAVGFAMGSVSPVMEAVTNEFHLSDRLRGLFGSATLIGNLFGSPVGGIMADKLGRKRSLLITWLLHIFAALGESFSYNVSLLLLTRMLIGFTTGAHYAAATTYMSEMLDSKLVDKVMSFVELNFFVGAFISFALMFILKEVLGGKAYLWRLLLSASIIPMTIAIIILLAYLDESSVYLANKKRKQVTGIEDVPEEGASIFTKDNLKAILFISTFWTSISTPSYCIGAFSIKLIEGLNIQWSSDLINSLMGFTGILGVVAGMMFISYIGIKNTLLSGVISTAVSFFVVGMISKQNENPGVQIQIIAAFMLLLYNACCNIASPLIFIYPGKMFPSSIKGTACGICAMISRFITIVCMFGTSKLVSNSPAYAISFGVALFMLSGGIILSFVTPGDKKFQALYEKYQKQDEEHAQLYKRRLLNV